MARRKVPSGVSPGAAGQYADVAQREYRPRNGRCWCNSSHRQSRPMRAPKKQGRSLPTAGRSQTDNICDTPEAATGASRSGARRAGIPQRDLESLTKYADASASGGCIAAENKTRRGVSLAGCLHQADVLEPPTRKFSSIGRADRS